MSTTGRRIVAPVAAANADLNGWLAGRVQDFEPAAYSKPMRKLTAGVIVHHTATPRSWAARRSAEYVARESPIAPCYNVLVGRGGEVFPITRLGVKANHAGRGEARVLRDMIDERRPVQPATTHGAAYCNSQTWGVAIDNDGLREQVSENAWLSLVLVVAALCAWGGYDPASQVVGHAEWTTRKSDPVFAMSRLRLDVSAADGHMRPWDEIVRQAAPPPPLHLPTLRRGSRGVAVRDLQRRLNVPVDGIFGRQTDRAVRDFQRAAGLAADGIVGRRTWGSLAP